MPWSPQLFPSRNNTSMCSATDPLTRGTAYFKSSLFSGHRTPAPINPASACRVPVTSLTSSPISEQVLLPQMQSLRSIPLPTKSDERRVPEPDTIPHLREAIHKLDSKMACLMSQRRELESHLEQAVRSQSPVLRLPDELLSSIFIIGVQSTKDEDALMLSCLMLVCRHWAEVAINTPALWTKIVVSKHDSLRKAQRKLERSKSAPLDLTINFGPRSDYSDYSDGVTENVIHAMDLFRHALWRTRSFRLSVPTRAQAHAALLRCREDAPLLELVSIRVFQSIQDDHYSQPPLPLFNGCVPKLQSCSFTSFNFGWDLHTLVRLRVLKLGGYFNGLSPSVDTLLSTIQENPDLEEFGLRDMSDIDLEDCAASDEEHYRIPARRALPLHRLTKVALNCAGIMRCRLLLAQISFPALRSLELCYLSNITPILHQLESQSLTSLPLKSLRIESCLFNELKLVQLLRRLPSLTTLDLVDNEDASSCLLKSLATPAPGQPWVCPHLESVSLEGCTSLESDALRTLIEARLPAHSIAYPRQHEQQPARSTSASAFARTWAVHAEPVSSGYGAPCRLRAIDVTRCHQISKEMVQWMRMYVADVRCEPPNGTWGEFLNS